MDPLDFIVTFVDGFDEVKGNKFFALERGGSLIEICGEPGSGKTCFCMQLAVNLTVSEACEGLEGGAIYIRTDNNFYRSRLLDIYTETADILDCDWDFDGSFYDHTVRSVSGLLRFIAKIEKDLAENESSLRLIVIDSLSALFRNMMDRFKKMVRLENKLMARLKNLAQRYDLMIIVTSQISNKSLASESYSHWADKRLLLYRFPGNRYIAQIDKFGSLHPLAVKFQISSGGVRTQI